MRLPVICCCLLALWGMQDARAQATVVPPPRWQAPPKIVRPAASSSEAPEAKGEVKKFIPLGKARYLPLNAKNAPRPMALPPRPLAAVRKKEMPAPSPQLADASLLPPPSHKSKSGMTHEQAQQILAVFTPPAVE